MQSVKKFFTLVILLIAFQVAVSIFGAVFISAQDDPGKILEGVKVGRVNLGGLTKSEARKELTRAIEPGFSDSMMTITHKDQSWEVKYSDLGIFPDYELAITNAYQAGRERNPMTRMFSEFRSKRQGIKLPLNYKVERQKVTAFISNLAKKIDQQAVDAEIYFRADKLVIAPEKKGIKVLVDDSAEALTISVNKGQDTSRLVVKELLPQIASQELEGIKEDLAVAVTSFDPRDTNRAGNIMLASKLINNTLVRPGEVFSFNQRVGSRTDDKGFREAKVIANSNLIEGVGGGVCQVSTTLYQAVLLAGLEPIERHPHSLPPGYVPLGQDAAVADGQLDMKFKNTREEPLLVIAYAEDNDLFIRIMGNKEANEAKIRLVSEVVEEIQPKVVVRKDSRLAKGISEILERGQKGYYVKVFRESTYESGKKEKELITKDRYQSRETVVRLGTKEIIKNLKSKKK